MIHGWCITLLFISMNILAFDISPEELNDYKQHNIGEYAIIEYPKASKPTFEIKYKRNPLIAKSGNDIAVLHPHNHQQVVLLEDANGDGIYDRLDYDLYDEQGRYKGTTSDRDFDGQSDFKIRVDYVNGKPTSSAFVWLGDRWYQVHERNLDQPDRINRSVKIDGEWVHIDISQFPFKLIY